VKCVATSTHSFITDDTSAASSKMCTQGRPSPRRAPWCSLDAARKLIAPTARSVSDYPAAAARRIFGRTGGSSVNRARGRDEQDRRPALEAISSTVLRLAPHIVDRSQRLRSGMPAR